MTLPWKEGRRQVSRQEYDLRWNYALGKTTMTMKELNKQIKEIRERTKKP